MVHKGISKDTLRNLLQWMMMLKSKAQLKDGMLRVSMEKIVSEAKKLKTIEIK